LIGDEFRVELFAICRLWKVLIPVFLICSGAFAVESRLPFGTVFKGQDQFNRLVAKAKSENWQALPIGERTANRWGWPWLGHATSISRSRSITGSSRPL